MVKIKMEEKTCQKCKKSLPINFYYKNKRRKDGLQDYCKKCKKAQDSKSFQNHKSKWVKHYSQKAKEKKHWFDSLRAKERCQKCGENRYYVLDYHHIDPEGKIKEISSLVWSVKKEKVLEEIKKCVVLCKNCHAEFHHLERQNSITTKEFLKSSFV